MLFSASQNDILSPLKSFLGDEKRPGGITSKKWRKVGQHALKAKQAESGDEIMDPENAEISPVKSRKSRRGQPEPKNGMNLVHFGE